MARLVEPGADASNQLRVHASRVEPSHVVPKRSVDDRRGSVEPNPPEPVAESIGDFQGRANRVVLEVDEDDDVDPSVETIREHLGSLDRVAVVKGDQRVRYGADALSSPPRRLCIG